MKKISLCRFWTMVTYGVTKMVSKFSPMIGQLFDIMTEASSDKEWL